MMFSFRGKLGLAGLLFLAVSMLMVSPSLGGTIVENFANNQYDKNLWYHYTSGPGVTGGLIHERLEITLPQSAGGTQYQAGMGSEFVLAGDFEMQVDFELLNWPDNNASQIGLTLNQANDFSIFRRSRGLNEGGGGEIYYTMIKNQMTQVQASGTSGKLKMKRTGNKMEGFYYDGANWQLVGSYTDPSLGWATSVHLDFDRDAPFSGPSVQAAFDNILVTYTKLMWTIFESFDDNEFDQDLFWLNISGGASATVASQQLQVTIPGNPGSDYWVAGLDNRFKLVGDFDIQVDFSLPAWPSGNGVNAGIITPLFQVTRNSHYENGPVPGPVDTYLAYFAPGQVFYWVNTADPSGKMRLQRTGNYIEAFYWQNGAWQSIGSHTDPQLGFPIEGYIGAYSGGYGQSKAVQANFDNYQITYDQIIFSGGGCPAAAILHLLLN